MTSFISAEGGTIWIKFRRLVQNDMPIAATLKPEVEFQCGGRLGEFNGMSSLQSIITLEGAATWWIHCHDPRTTCQIAGCSHLAKSMSWSCRIAGCKNSIRHIENRFRHILFIFFLMEFGIRGAAAFVLFPIHLFQWRLGELKQRLLVEWRKLDHSIVVAAISQCRRRLSAPVRAHGGHFEHILWCFHGSVC